MSKRTHNPKWADNTNAARQARRRAAIKAKAQAEGFSSVDAMLTAWLNSELKIIRVEVAY